MEIPAKRPRLSQQPESLDPDSDAADDENTDADAEVEDWEEEYGGHEVEDDHGISPHPLECIDESDESYELAVEKAAADNRFRATMAHIFRKYGRDFEGIGDEIDLVTGEIVVNNGHLETMRNEVDVGDLSDEDEEATNSFFGGHLLDQVGHDPFGLGYANFDAHNTDGNCEVYGDMYYDEPGEKEVRAERLGGTIQDEETGQVMATDAAAWGTFGLPAPLRLGGSLPYPADADACGNSPSAGLQCDAAPNVSEKYEFPIKEGQNSIWAPDYQFDKCAEPDDLCSARLNLLIRARHGQLKRKASPTAEEDKLASFAHSDRASNCAGLIDPQLEACRIPDSGYIGNHGADTNGVTPAPDNKGSSNDSGASAIRHTHSAFEGLQTSEFNSPLDFDSACILSDDESPLVAQQGHYKNGQNQPNNDSRKIGTWRTGTRSGTAKSYRRRKLREPRKYLALRSGNTPGPNCNKPPVHESRPQKPARCRNESDAVVDSSLSSPGMALAQVATSNEGNQPLKSPPRLSKHRFTNPLLAPLNGLMSHVPAESATDEALTSLQDLVQLQKHKEVLVAAPARSGPRLGRPRYTEPLKPHTAKFFATFKKLFPSLVLERSRGRPRKPTKEQSKGYLRHLPYGMIDRGDEHGSGITASEASWYNAARYLAYNITESGGSEVLENFLAIANVVNTRSSRTQPENDKGRQDSENCSSDAPELELEVDEEPLSKVVQPHSRSATPEEHMESCGTETDDSQEVGEKEEEKKHELEPDEGDTEDENAQEECGRDEREGEGEAGEAVDEDEQRAENGNCETAPGSTIPDSTFEDESPYFLEIGASINGQPQECRSGELRLHESSIATEPLNGESETDAFNRGESGNDSDDDMESVAEQVLTGDFRGAEGRPPESEALDAGEVVSELTSSALSSPPNSWEASPDLKSQPPSEPTSKAASQYGLVPPSPKNDACEEALTQECGCQSPLRDGISHSGDLLSFNVYEQDSKDSEDLLRNQQDDLNQHLPMHCEVEAWLQYQDTEPTRLTNELLCGNITTHPLEIEARSEPTPPLSNSISTDGLGESATHRRSVVNHGTGPNTSMAQDQVSISDSTKAQSQSASEVSIVSKSPERLTGEAPSTQRTEREHRRSAPALSYTRHITERNDEDGDELGPDTFKDSLLPDKATGALKRFVCPVTATAIRPPLSLKASAARPASVGSGNGECVTPAATVAVAQDTSKRTSELQAVSIARSSPSFVASQRDREQLDKAAVRGHGRSKEGRREKRRRYHGPERRHTSIGISGRSGDASRDDGRVCGIDGYQCHREFCFKCLA